MKRSTRDLPGAMMSPLSSIGGPDEVPLEETTALPQRDGVWECAVRRARAWITPPDCDPYRPYIILTASRAGRVVGTGKVVGSEVIEGPPTPPQVVNALAKAMLYPAPNAGGRRRPATIYVDDAALVKSLSPELEKVGVRVAFRHTLREAEQALQSLERFGRDEEPVPGLLEAPGVTPSLVERLFEAASFFYREAPWYWIDDAQPIQIRYPVDSEPHYAVVMGQGGQAYGLAVYDSIDVLYQTYAGVPPDQVLGLGAWTVLLFGEAMEMPFDDLDAIEIHDWPVAGQYAYPVFLRFDLSGQPSRPSRAELLQMEAALLAIPPFVLEHMEADEGPPHSAEETLTVTPGDGEDRISLTYPIPGFEMPSDDGALFIAEHIGIDERNAELLHTFEQCLRGDDLSARTVDRHLDNIRRFAVRYLGMEGGSLEFPCSADEATPADVDEFLADWLLYEGDGSPVEAVRSHIASLKKFYICLRETGSLPVDDADEILQLLQEDRAYYLEVAGDFEEGTLNDGGAG